jgi:hypothetical protein
MPLVFALRCNGRCKACRSVKLIGNLFLPAITNLNNLEQQSIGHTKPSMRSIRATCSCFHYGNPDLKVLAHLQRDFLLYV